ncbi:monomeric [FeFe] hydrogenase [Mobilibacterium timonense]|uniref:monomeric [FeFe] hydrogenase n=1 Tax=Mobilibacterium timonense TaxID=1871012 RepID=UPI0009854868|nr:monomeric [FeFe] hydrogenase [Mobilibacterium timonense]
MTVYADQNLMKTRENTVYQVASLAWDHPDDLDKELEYLPDKVIPGPLPTYRCCIYREREVFRQRIRLSTGKAPVPEDNGRMIHVLTPACSDCPISGYLVTEVCQNCAGKSCLNSCKFGAVIIGKDRTEIDKTKCKECGMCARSCPYNAIVHIKRPCKTSCPVGALTYDENGLAVIDPEKCISCGQCLHKCPFGAIGTRDSILQVIRAIQSGKRVYAMVAPAAEGQYGKGITVESWRQAAKKIGFYDLVEVALGADLTTEAEAMEWHEAYLKGENKVTSCCPAFVNLINTYYPELSSWVSTSVSPMCQLSRLIKAKDPEAVTVFIGPCVAKKSEVQDQKIDGNADYSLIFDEFEALLRSRGVWFEPQEERETGADQQGSVYGKRYANAGGVANSVVEYLKEKGFNDELPVIRVSGVKEIKKVLDSAVKGRLMEDYHAQFIEGMCCEGGCFHGPCSNDTSVKARKVREDMLSKADDRTIMESLDTVFKSEDSPEFKRHR